MTRRTAEAVEAWVGRDAVDAEGAELGVVAEVLRDGGGAVSGLRIAGERGGLSVAIAGCEPTGRAVRLPIVRAAPPSPGAGATTAGAAQRDAARPPRAPAARVPEIVGALRSAHALEGEALVRLAALARAIGDAELAHDATLHAHESELHRAGVQARLAALGAGPSALRGAARGARAAVAGLLEGLRGDRLALLRDAEAFERREMALYAELERLARESGDAATAELAAAHRADEEAMAARLAASIPRLDSPV